VTEALSAILGAAVAWLLFRLGLQAETHRHVGELYDKLVDYRKEYPEVLSLARLWRPEYLTRVYHQRSDEDRQWAMYYGYAELVLGYCTQVLVTRGCALAGRAYTQHHHGLVKLLLTEHYPIVKQLAAPGGYASPLIARFIERQRAQGWDWESRHSALDRVAGHQIAPPTSDG